MFVMIAMIAMIHDQFFFRRSRQLPAPVVLLFQHPDYIQTIPQNRMGVQSARQAFTVIIFNKWLENCDVLLPEPDDRSRVFWLQ